jgi:hypothetical protein
MTSTEVCQRRSEEARVRADQSVYPDEQEAWLTVASEWMKLAHQPIHGLMEAFRRTYAGRSRKFP